MQIFPHVRANMQAILNLNAWSCRDKRFRSSVVEGNGQKCIVCVCACIQFHTNRSTVLQYTCTCTMYVPTPTTTRRCAGTIVISILQYIRMYVCMYIHMYIHVHVSISCYMNVHTCLLSNDNVMPNTCISAVSWICTDTCTYVYVRTWNHINYFVTRYILQVTQ